MEIIKDDSSSKFQSDRDFEDSNPSRNKMRSNKKKRKSEESDESVSSSDNRTDKNNGKPILFAHSKTYMQKPE